MDEARYLAETVPVVLLEFLRPRLTDKQLRLFAAACHPDEKYWQEWASGKKYDFPTFTGEEGALYCVGRKVGQNHAVQLRPAEKARRCDFLRDIAGPWRMPEFRISAPDRWICGGCGFVFNSDNRFTNFAPCDCGAWNWRQTTELDEWLTPATVALARGILEGREVECADCCKGTVTDKKVGGLYPHCPTCHGTGKLSGEPDWEGLPLLGDLLQENGCEVPEIIEHCYTDKPHCRGCWLIELLIGGGHA